eukprot:Gb_09973 [translate_table: standard]
MEVKQFHGRMVISLMVAAMVLPWQALVCYGELQSAPLVTGMVFCDQCSMGSLSALSQPLAGADVSLQCGENSTAVTVASTDENGVFSISVELENPYQIYASGECTVKLVRSNNMHCQVPTEIEKGGSGAPIYGGGGVYRERAVYYVGPFAYRMNQPEEACNALRMNTKHSARLQSFVLPFRAAFRGLKSTEEGFRDEMVTVPSTAATKPYTGFSSRSGIPSYNIPVTKPTPVDNNSGKAPRPPRVSTGTKSPPNCIPIPPLPLNPELTAQLHYPPCKTQPPAGGAPSSPPPKTPTLKPPRTTPIVSPPIRTNPPTLPPLYSPPVTGSTPPKGQSRTPPPSPPLSVVKPVPPPPKTTPPPQIGSPPAPSTPPIKKHPFHRPHPSHKPPPPAGPLQPPPPSPSPISKPSPSPYKIPPPSIPKPPRHPLPPFPHLEPFPPFSHSPQPRHHPSPLSTYHKPTPPIHATPPPQHPITNPPYKPNPPTITFPRGPNSAAAPPRCSLSELVSEKHSCPPNSEIPPVSN